MTKKHEQIHSMQRINCQFEHLSIQYYFRVYNSNFKFGKLYGLGIILSKMFDSLNKINHSSVLEQ